jgi:transketolase
VHRHDSHAVHRRDPAGRLGPPPGTPIGIAPVTYTLWQQFLRFDPSDPIWPNRDRYVLSSGHASTLLWSMLHLTRVRAVDPDYEVLGQPAVSLDDLKHFRQLDSRAPGHPEYRWTSGVEATTGPLGTGAATSVGMAVASQWLAARYNRDGFTLFDFDVTRRPATEQAYVPDPWG